ncbi:MAG: DUF3307 domain-containing protein [Pseudomonadota bacterium]
MIEALHTLAALVTAHLLADFAFQTDWMIAHKRRPLVFAAHIAVVGLLSAVAIGWLYWPVLAIVVATHAAMDAVKLWLLKSGLAGFAVDQAVHLAIIAGVALAWPDLFDRGAWTLLPDPLPHAVLLGFTTAAAIVAAVPMGGIVIGMLLAPLRLPARANIQGLKQGGRYIGWLERALTLLFVAIGQPTGVGLLLAAKSILRFGDIKDTRQRARTEYIMIGTFLSFGWALVVAVVARAVATHL